MSPPGRGTRPTADRVREALFSALESRLGGPGSLTGLRVLDLFCGTGALGIEALSRGARQAVFVERDAGALGALRENLETLGIVERSRILPGEARHAIHILARSGERFDVAFVDPPYGTGEAASTLEEIAGADVLRAGGWVALEHASREQAPDTAGLVLAAEPTRRYGTVALTLYTRAAGHSEATPAPSEDAS